MIRDRTRASITTCRYAGLGLFPQPDVVLFDLSDGSELARFSASPHMINEAVLSPDGHWIALTHDGRICTIRIPDPVPPAWTPEPAATWPIDGDAAFSADGRMAVWDEDGRLQIVRPSSLGALVQTRISVEAWLSWSPDAKWLIEMCLGGRMVFRCSQTLAVIDELAGTGDETELAIAHDGTQVATIDKASVVLWQTPAAVLAL